MRNISNDSTANDAFPAFPPDGNKIVFRSKRNTGAGVDNPEDPPDHKIFTTNFDENLAGVTQLTVNDDADNFPNWGEAPT